MVDALNELPQGANHALKTCLTEWAGQRLSEKNLLNFIKSISWQSAALFRLFNDRSHTEVEECELLTEQEMMVLLVNPWGSQASD